MSQIIKYLLVALLSIALTILYLDQYAPIIVEVPEKVSQRMEIEFSKEIERRPVQKIEKKAKNVIILIGDGMGINQITAYKIAKGGPNYSTSFDRFPFSGLVKVHSFDNLITDSAASATAFSSGIKTKNRYLGVDSNGDDVELITEILLRKGFITGLVATSEITHATPAGFSIHNISRYNTDEIAKSMYDSKNHILMGGGKDFFMPKSKGGKREDGLNFVDLIKEKHVYLESKEALMSFKGETSKRIFGLFAKEGLIRSEDEPSLLDMFEFTLNQSAKMSQKNGCSGFFIMAEGSQIDWAGHENDFDYQFEEMDEFHDVVDHALNFVKSRDDTLLIVLSDHETGGLLIEMDELRRKPSSSMIVSWNTAIEEGTHTGTMIPAFSYGPGAINFTGVMDNTDVFFSVKEAIGISDIADNECKLDD